MITSRFRHWAFLPPGLALFITWLLYEIISEDIFSPPDISWIAMLPFTCVCLFTWIWLILGELRTKAISAEINNDAITIANFFGLGSKRQFGLNEFDGFTTSAIESRNGSFEYLYLLKGDRKIVKLSEFYHKNYADLKKELWNKIKFLGERPFNLTVEIKEIFE